MLILCTSVDESFKAISIFPDFMTNRDLSCSEEPTASPLNIAFKTPHHLWSWYQQPGNELRQKRFGIAMAGTQKLHPPETILDGEQDRCDRLRSC
jgi:hypothetical protein